MEKILEQKIPYRVGQWLSSDQKFLESWLQNLIDDVDRSPQELHPVIQEFQDLIEGDPELYMLFYMMFEQIPHKPPYFQTPTHKPQVRNYKHMLQLLNAIMTKAPEYNDTGLVGFPINAILDWPMGTIGGFSAFLNEKVNRQLKKILNEWARFLGSKDSCYVLNRNSNGWFGPSAMEQMPNFAAEFQCDPEKEHFGFNSWDDFFTRQFREGIRPIAEPENDNVIVNACESAPYKIARNVKNRDRFWIKSQPYSLEHMLAGDPLTKEFVGGSIYQAFLSALSYHRWHSPVSGRIVKAYVTDGSYYSEALSQGFLNPNGPDPSAPNNSQAYLTEVAARAMIFIEADNPAIGLMCFLSVGMSEVSTNEITVYEGQHVNKGDQLGMFHFGGSTHCLLFRPGVNIEFDTHGQEPGLHSHNIPINSQIARVK
ncbi:MAG: phosphatidylserine decarboxylase family protein [Marinifilaceae bacterium]